MSSNRASWAEMIEAEEGSVQNTGSFQMPKSNAFRRRGRSSESSYGSRNNRYGPLHRDSQSYPVHSYSVEVHKNTPNEVRCATHLSVQAFQNDLPPRFRNNSPQIIAENQPLFRYYDAPPPPLPEPDIPKQLTISENVTKDKSHALHCDETTESFTHDDHDQKKNYLEGKHEKSVYPRSSKQDFTVHGTHQKRHNSRPMGIPPPANDVASNQKLHKPIEQGPEYYPCHDKDERRNYQRDQRREQRKESNYDREKYHDNVPINPNNGGYREKKFGPRQYEDGEHKSFKPHDRGPPRSRGKSVVYASRCFRRRANPSEDDLNSNYSHTTNSYSTPNNPSYRNHPNISEKEHPNIKNKMAEDWQAENKNVQKTSFVNTAKSYQAASYQTKAPDSDVLLLPKETKSILNENKRGADALHKQESEVKPGVLCANDDATKETKSFSDKPRKNSLPRDSKEQIRNHLRERQHVSNLSHVQGVNTRNDYSKQETRKGHENYSRLDDTAKSENRPQFQRFERGRGQYKGWRNFRGVHPLHQGRKFGSARAQNNSLCQTSFQHCGNESVPFSTNANDHSQHQKASSEKVKNNCSDPNDNSEHPQTLSEGITDAWVDSDVHLQHQQKSLKSEVELDSSRSQASHVSNASDEKIGSRQAGDASQNWRGHKHPRVVRGAYNSRTSHHSRQRGMHQHHYSEYNQQRDQGRDFSRRGQRDPSFKSSMRGNRHMGRGRYPNNIQRHDAHEDKDRRAARHETSTKPSDTGFQNDAAKRVPDKRDAPKNSLQSAENWETELVSQLVKSTPIDYKDAEKTNNAQQNCIPSSEDWENECLPDRIHLSNIDVSEVVVQSENITDVKEEGSSVLLPENETHCSDILDVDDKTKNVVETKDSCQDNEYSPQSKPKITNDEEATASKSGRVQHSRVQGSWGGKPTNSPYHASVSPLQPLIQRSGEADNRDNELAVVSPRNNADSSLSSKLQKIQDFTLKYEETEEIEEEIKEPQILKEGQTVISTEPSGPSVIIYEPNFLSPDQTEEFFDYLYTNIKWEKREIIVDGKLIKQPRAVAWFGPFPYSYSGLTLEPNIKLPGVVVKIRELVEEYLFEHDNEAEFNSVLLNLYEDGHDSVAWHSDDELSLGICPVIASVSLGETRRFEMKRKTSTMVTKANVPPVSYMNTASPRCAPNTDVEFYTHLGDGSLFIMSGATQNDWLHRVPKEYHDKRPRINLTFRTIYALK